MPGKPAKPRPPQARYNAVSYIIETLGATVPHPIREVVFAPGRRWAFDLAWLDYKVAVEYEGATWQMGGHNSGAGYRSDVDKYNTAAIFGWLLIRITADMLRDLSFVRPILQALAVRGYGEQPISEEPVAHVNGAIKADPWEGADIGGE